MCHKWHITIDGITSDESVVAITAHTRGKSAICPNCGKRSTSVHGRRLRKIQCAEFLGCRTILILETRHFFCTNAECSSKTFAEPLSMVQPYGRHSHEVEKSIFHEALHQPARLASDTLAMQHITVSRSSITRRLHAVGCCNPDVHTSGYIGMDDFAKKKGHEYMTVITDHYTRQPFAVFDLRYGSEITDWIKGHPEIKVITRDGSRQYESIISSASANIIQISDRFHLVQNLKKYSIEPIQKMLGQSKEKQKHPYSSEEEAYRFIMDDMHQMGEAKHRKKYGFTMRPTE